MDYMQQNAKKAKIQYFQFSLLLWSWVLADEETESPKGKYNISMVIQIMKLKSLYLNPVLSDLKVHVLYT